MMPKSIYVLLLCLAAGGLLGCRQQAETSAEASHQRGSAAPRPADGALEPNLGVFAREDLATQSLPAGLTGDAPPGQIVTAFLNALRSGDSGVAEALLTRRAREETRKRDLTVQPLGSPEATFTVGSPQYLDARQTGAHVNTTWTEQQSGEVVHYDIIWALRSSDAGWRVAGMGAQLAPGQPVVYLNFEEPDDMLAKWRAAEETVAATQAADSGIRQAQSLEGGNTIQR